jgi:hypothetical protein
MAALALLLLLAPSPEADPFARLKDPTRLVRERAVRRLAACERPTAELAARLDDPSVRVAAGVAEALAERDDPAALPALLAAADGPVPARAGPAARAAVRIALEHRVLLDGIDVAGRPRLEARLAAEVRAAVLASLGELRHEPACRHGACYGPLLAAGRFAAPALRALAFDEGRPGRLRGHALHAYARLVGAAAAPVVDRALADPLERLRIVAARLAERYGFEASTRRLAAWLDEDRVLSTTEIAVGIRALPEGARIGDAAAKRLRGVVRHGPHYYAADAAAALRATRPAEAEAALRLRIDDLLSAPALANGNSLVLVGFWCRLGPFDDALRQRFEATGQPVLRAVLAPDWKTARARLGGLVAPDLPVGGREPGRVRAVYLLLRRFDAPPADRVAYARSVLGHDASVLRRYGLWSLRGIEPEAWRALRPVVARCLDDHDEWTRLAAARLLVPDPRALRVCGESLYLGDPVAAREVASILGARCPAEAAAPVAERRRRALEFLGALEE